MKTPDLIGHTFGRLTVLRKDKNEYGNTVWAVRCICGTERIFRTATLRSGKTKSCGCLRRETAAASCRNRNRTRTWGSTHGHYKNNKRSPTYQSWTSMRDRCTNKNHPAYRNYGGRGIVICERWKGDLGFKSFLENMGIRPDGTSLDRIDVNGNYEPQNCRWLAIDKQNSNRRKYGTLSLFSIEELREEIIKRESRAKEQNEPAS